MADPVKLAGGLEELGQTVRRRHQAHCEALRGYGPRARSLMPQEAKARGDWLRERLEPELPGLGPLRGVWESMDTEMTLERHRRVLSWMLTPSQSQGLAQSAWEILREHLRAEEPLSLLDMPSLRVSPEPGGEPWGSLDLFAWNPEARWGMAIAVSLESSQDLALDRRLDHYVQRVHHRYGEEATRRICWVRITRRGAPIQSAWGTRQLWNTVSWVQWRDIWWEIARAQEVPAFALAAARYAHALDGQVLTSLSKSNTLRGHLPREPGLRLLCAMQEAWYEGPR